MAFLFTYYTRKKYLDTLKHFKDVTALGYKISYQALNH